MTRPVIPTMTREFLCTALALSLTLGSTCGADSQPLPGAKPNVLMIVTDDQGYADFSAMGHPYVKTPVLDRLRSESRVLDTFLTAPVCAPTRAGLLTGRHPYRTGVYDTYQSRVNLHPDEVTLAEHFKEAGYRTAAIGKWHLGYNAPLRPSEQGFDTYVTWEESQYSRFNPLLEANGVVYRGEGFLSDLFADSAEAFIRQAPDQPFFLYYAMFLPHNHPDNHEVPQSWMKRFEAFPELDPRMRSLFGMIEKTDQLVGRILKVLEETGQANNTIVIFMSDNGAIPRPKEGKADFSAGLRGYKGQVYENGIRVPFFIRWPEKIEPGLLRQPAGFYVDVAPTLLELAGVSPAPGALPMDGQSLAGPLLGASEPFPERSFKLHFLRGGRDAILADPFKNSVVRGPRYKLVHGKELYDLEQDPGETRDLAAMEPGRVEAMRAEYEQWFAGVTAQRDLRTAPNHIGDPRQKMVNLHYFEKDQEATPAGWPVEVLDPGPYRVSIEEIQHGMFEGPVTAVLRVGDQEWRQPVERRFNDLHFEPVLLPKGRHVFELEFEGTRLPKKWRYNLDDLGHRTLRIFPVAPSNSIPDEKS